MAALDHDAMTSGTSGEVGVLFIGGMGRSGSTLLDRMLGSAPGVVSVGEIRKFWRRGAVANELCGCGERIRSCPFWRAVADEAFGGFDVPGLDAIAAAEDRLLVPLRKALPLRFALLRRGRDAQDFEMFAEARLKLIRAVAKVSGASLVIDSSKGPLYGAALGQVEGLDVRAVHLVRDSRAVAFSWLKVKEVRRVPGQLDYMPRISARDAALQWITKNLQMESLWVFTGRRMRLHYEAFVERPEWWVRRVLRFAGHDALAASAADGEVELPVQHTVLGNPMRFDRGRIAVRLDDEWKRGLAARERRTVTAITLPMLLRYGYAGPLPLAGGKHRA